MERPTCGTCPYWLLLDEDSLEETTVAAVLASDPELNSCEVDGECKRYPGIPKLVIFPIDRHPDGSCKPGVPGTYRIGNYGGPNKSADDWCGEHPEMGAYIARLQPKPPEVNLPLGEKMKAALLNLDEGAGDEIMARTLTPRELEIMRLAFGFGEGRVPYTLDEIARIFKITRARSRQIHDKAVQKLSLLREVRDASLIPLDSPA